MCNLRPEVPETEGFDVGMHVEALVEHGVTVDVVLCDPAGMTVGNSGPGGGQQPGPPQTAWPTTQSNWRRPCRICSDDARTEGMP